MDYQLLQSKCKFVNFSFGIGENFTAMTNEGINDFMNAEEEENANEFRFMQEEEVPHDERSSAVMDSANQSPGFQASNASIGKDLVRDFLNGTVGI